MMGTDKGHKRSIEEANLLVDRNFGLVRDFMKRQAAWLDQDELLSISMLGLLMASRHYDPCRGTQFSTCANKFMKTELRHYLHERKRKTDRGCVAPKSLFHHDGEMRNVRDKRRRPDEDVSEREWARHCLNIGLSRLTRKERAVLLAHLVDGKRFADIADGQTRQAVGNSFARAVEKSRQAIESHMATQPFRGMRSVSK